MSFRKPILASLAALAFAVNCVPARAADGVPLDSKSVVSGGEKVFGITSTGGPAFQGSLQSSVLRAFSGLNPQAGWSVTSVVDGNGDGVVNGLDTHRCGATLIAPSFALTAAHCIAEVALGVFSVVSRPSDLSVVFNSPTLSPTGPNAVTRSVSSVTLHPSYLFGSLVQAEAAGVNPEAPPGIANLNLNQIWDHDIAILQLSAPVTTITPVRLGSEAWAAPGTPSLITGFGLNSAAPGVSNLLRTGSMVVAPDGICTSGNAANLCTVGTAWGGIGDSGGPILVSNPSNPAQLVQVAVTSLGGGYSNNLCIPVGSTQSWPVGSGATFITSTTGIGFLKPPSLSTTMGWPPQPPLSGTYPC